MAGPVEVKYDGEFKAKVVAFARLYNSRAACGKFCLKENLVLEWCKEASLMRPEDKRVVSGTPGVQQGGPEWPEMEEALAGWVSDRQRNGAPVSRASICQEAARWAKLRPQKAQGFRVTRVWLRKFLRRKGLVLKPGPKTERPPVVDLVEEEKYKNAECVRNNDEKMDVAESSRSSSSKRTIKKPKMDQFVTFSDCSDLEEEFSTDLRAFPVSDDDSSYRGNNSNSESEHSTRGTSKIDGGVTSWATVRVPDEVSIREVNPSLEVYLDMETGKAIKVEPCDPQDPYVESTMGVDAGDRIMEPTPPHVVNNCSVDNRGGVVRQEGRFTLGSDGHLKLCLDKRKSVVWRHFTSSGQDSAVCLHCSARFKIANGSTSPLARHILGHLRKQGLWHMGTTDQSTESDEGLKKFPPHLLTSQCSEASWVQTVALPSDKKEMAAPVVLGVTTDHFKAITEKVVLMMVKDYQPPSIVNDPGFRSLIAELEPEYELPSASHFSNVAIRELYEKTSAKMKAEYKESSSSAKSCLLTVDKWSSAVGDVTYLAIACYCTSANFEISRRFLANRSLSGKQSGHDTYRVVLSVLEDWGFDRNEMQAYVLTENARDLQAAASSAKSPWVAIQCFAHSLQLAVRDAIDSSPGYVELLHKARAVSRHHGDGRITRGQKEGSESCVAKEDLAFEDCVGQFSWIAEYRTIERLLQLKEEVGQERDDLVDVEEAEWTLAEGVVDILRPIDEAMRDPCPSNGSPPYHPLSMAIPIIYGIEHMLARELESPAPSSQGSPKTPNSPSPAKGAMPSVSSPKALFAKNLLKAVRARFPSYRTNRTGLVAMVLDPRYKAVILKEPEVSLVTKMLVDEMAGLSSCQAPLTREAAGTQRGAGTQLASSSILWSAFEKVSQEQPAGSERKLALYQVKQYLDEPVVSRSCDPLSWWTENREKYNLIIPLAAKYASIPAMLGSLKGRNGTLEGRRALLPVGAYVDQLVFLHENA